MALGQRARGEASRNWPGRVLPRSSWRRRSPSWPRGPRTEIVPARGRRQHADPLLLITRRVPGTSLFDVAGSTTDHAARQIVRTLAALHHPATRHRAEAAVGPLTGPRLPPATTGTLRGRLGTWVRPDQRRTVVRLVRLGDAVLAQPGPAVLVHRDLHGDNQGGTTTSCGWWWTSRPSERPSPSTSWRLSRSRDGSRPGVADR